MGGPISQHHGDTGILAHAACVKQGGNLVNGCAHLTPSVPATLELQRIAFGLKPNDLVYEFADVH